MSDSISDSSCRNCKYLETLQPRVEGFGFRCVLAGVRVGLIEGGGRTKALDVSDDGKALAFTRLLMTQPQYVSCQKLEPKP